jgi:hypothetical protein
LESGALEEKNPGGAAADRGSLVVSTVDPVFRRDHPV